MNRTLILSLLGALVSVSFAAETPAPAASSNTQWLSYNGNVNGQRYADLTQINATNAAQLGEVCRLKVDDTGAFHTGILQIEGVLYFTTASDTLAVDATNCAVRWRHHYVAEETGGSALQVNRGVAHANGKLFRGTLDGRLLAIEMASGKTAWQFQIGDDFKAGKTRTRLAAMVARRVQSKIDAALRAAGPRPIGEDNIGVDAP